MSKVLDVLKKNTMIFVLLLVYIFFTAMTKGQMFVPLNFNALITQNAYVYILATGMLVCMLTGGNIDLSCGSFVCFAGAIGGVCMAVNEWGVGVSIFVMLAVGLIYGAVLGFLIAYVNVPPWIATLAGYLAFRGWGTAVLTKASTTASLSIDNQKSYLKIFTGSLFSDIDKYSLQIQKAGVAQKTIINIPCLVIGGIACIIVIAITIANRVSRKKKGYSVDGVVFAIIKTVAAVAVIALFAYKLSRAGGIPTVLVWVVVIVLIYEFITSKTTIGRYFYMLGDNAEATRLSGIDTKRIMFLAYLNMAFLTIISTYTVIARFRSANAFLGINFEMDAISACVVGGVSAYGGSGSVFGMVVGATLIGVINLGMSLMGIDANWQKVIKGLVLLLAVVFEIVNNKDKSKG